MPTKKNQGNKIKLGIFVSVGLLIFTAGIYFIGQKQQLFNNTFTISGIFKDISGLEVGNNVRFSGINVGVISTIEIISDSSVRVDMSIESKAQKFIKKDAKATIGSDGLMGNKIVIIMPGKSNQKQVNDNDFIGTSMPVSLDDILVKLQLTSNNAANITDNLSAITDNIRSGKGTIGKLFMDTVLAKNIDQSIINIKQGAGGFKQNMEAASHNILLRGFIKHREKKQEEKEKKQEEKK